eukprot:TRINITY_DN67166_c1_g1_i5.p1 TRINITY_DN67166_c1_g1~~TRINITY_DN67166_c1_g1_i5.p1  ORF type:complete len:622 (+),score=32.64 TRINITY_DN67166_c1_g1_i5:32-1897(+)
MQLLTFMFLWSCVHSLPRVSFNVNNYGKDHPAPKPDCEKFCFSQEPQCKGLQFGDSATPPFGIDACRCLTDPVPTSGGLVQGRLWTPTAPNRKAVETFLGIPYADPPARFQDPTARTPWQGVFEATNGQSQCPKVPRGSSEQDCLIANIWTPSTQRREKLNKKLPVVVYMHGGSHAFGTSGTIFSSGFDWAAQEDIIVVSINARLSIWGSLCWRDENGNNLVDGNFMLKDQAFALKWVYDNIGNFGGDQNHISVSGSSAGAYDIWTLIQSPQLKVPIKYAYLQSPPLIPAMVKGGNANVVVDTFLSAIGCTNGTSQQKYNCLMGTSDEQIWAHTSEILTAFTTLATQIHPTESLGPCYDPTLTTCSAAGCVVSPSSWVALPSPMSIEQYPVPVNAEAVLFSNVQHEGWGNVWAIFPTPLPNAAGTFQTLMRGFSLSTYSGFPANITNAQIATLEQTYFDTNNDLHEELASIQDDMTFNCPIRVIGDGLASQGKNVYKLWFTHVPGFVEDGVESYPDGICDADGYICHAVDPWFLWNTRQWSKWTDFEDRFTSEDVETSQAYQNIVISFLKTALHISSSPRAPHWKWLERVDCWGSNTLGRTLFDSCCWVAHLRLELSSHVC